MADNKYAFLMIIGVSLVLCSIAVFYFVRRRWLEP
jgi:Mg2+ and Co2+ transporter CorA